MPKQPNDAPGALHHVMDQGIDGTKIFSNRKDREFVNHVIADTEQKAKETLRLTLKICDILSLAMKVGEGGGVDEAELRSGLRKREVGKSRRIFCQIAVKKME